jgi:acyl-CoA thioesterase FadM
MALKTDIAGMEWPYPHRFVVGREDVRVFARAVKATDPASHDEAAAAELGYSAVVASLTFPAVFAALIQRHFLTHVDLGMDEIQMIQVDQSFRYHRAIVAGDVLRGTMYVESVNERFGADIVTTRSVCTDEGGEIVLEATKTMMGRHEDMSEYLTWNAATGRHVRTPGWLGSDSPVVPTG